MIRTDYVQNSNDSFWLTNPRQMLAGQAPVLAGNLVGGAVLVGCVYHLVYRDRQGGRDQEDSKEGATGS